MKTNILLSAQKPPFFFSAFNTGPSSALDDVILSFPYSVISEKIQSCNGKKNDRLKSITALIGKYYEAEGLVGIILHDKNGNQVVANRIAEKLYDSSRVKNINHLWKTGVISSLDEKPIPIEDSPFMQALQTNKPQKRSFNIHMKNGEQRWLFMHSKPLLEKDDGCVSCVVSSIIDITHEKKLALRIQERNDLVLSFMSETPNPAWIADEEGCLIFATAAFFTYFGLKEKSIGHKLSELIPPPLYRSLYAKHQKVLESNKPLKTIEHIETPNGTHFTCYINLFTLNTNGPKKLVAGHAVYLGNTVRTKTRHADVKKKLLMLSRATSDAIWEWDIKTGRIYRNKPLMNLVGYKPNGLAGLSWWVRHIHSQDLKRLKDKVKEAIEKNQSSWQEQYRFKCGDGSYKHVQDRGYIIYENGLPVRMIGSLTDVSQIKLLEEELISERIRRQTEIAETALKVQEVERTKIGQELHDNVNQILSTVKLFVDTIHPNVPKEQQAKAKSIEYISLAIEEIRKLSRELVAPQLKEKGLAENIKALIEDIHFTSPIRFKFTYNPQLKLLSPSKKTILFRIVQEQVKNILKHSNAKTAGISFCLKGEDVVLNIWDDGKGFELGRISKGIGLSNIQERVLMYSGTMDINSEPGKGCQLMITLPIM